MCECQVPWNHSLLRPKIKDNIKTRRVLLSLSIYNNICFDGSVCVSWFWIVNSWIVFCISSCPGDLTWDCIITFIIDTSFGAEGQFIRHDLTEGRPWAEPGRPTQHASLWVVFPTRRDSVSGPAGPSAVRWMRTASTQHDSHYLSTLMLWCVYY